MCPCAAQYGTVLQFAADNNLTAQSCSLGTIESQVHFGDPSTRLNLVYHTDPVRNWCSAFTSTGFFFQYNDLTPTQTSACRSIIRSTTNACTQQ